MSGTCVNCGLEFLVGEKGPKRMSLEFLAGKSRATRLVIEEVLGLSDGTITPFSKTSGQNHWLHRSLCRDCYAIIDKIERKSIEVDQLKKNFRDRNREDTYLREKLEASRSADRLVLSKTPPFPPRELSHDHVYISQASFVQKGRKTASKTPAKAPRGGKRAKIVPQEQHDPKDAQQETNNFSQQKIENKKPAIRYSFQSKAVGYINKSSYFRLFQLILKKSRSAKISFLRALSSMIRKEMAQFYRSAEYCCQPLTLETLKTFTWQKYYRETRKHLPTLHTVLEAALLRKGQAKKVCKDDRGPHVPAVGLLISVLLNLWKFRKFNLFQGIMGVQMYRYDIPKQAQDWLNKAGLCWNSCSIRNHIVRLKQEFEDEKPAQKRRPSIKAKQLDEVDYRKMLFQMWLQRCRILKDWRCMDSGTTTTTTGDHVTTEDNGEDAEEEELDEEAEIEEVDEELDEELEEEVEEPLDEESEEEIEDELEEDFQEELDVQLEGGKREEEFQIELNEEFEGESNENMEEDLEEVGEEEKEDEMRLLDQVQTTARDWSSFQWESELISKPQ